MLNGNAHWRNLRNTIEPSMCGGDAAFLSNYSDNLLFLLLLGCIAALARCSLQLQTEWRDLSVCLSVTTVSTAKTTEPIEIPFGLRIRVGSRNHALDGVQIPHGKVQF